MKVIIEEFDNPRVKLIYRLYGADKIYEGCFIKDKDKNVKKRRNTMDYRIAQKRLQAHTRLSGKKVKGGSSSRPQKLSPPCGGRGKNPYGQSLEAIPSN